MDDMMPIIAHETAMARADRRLRWACGVAAAAVVGLVMESAILVYVLLWVP